MNRTLGTQLRHLIELLDSAVDAAYADAGLSYRPRYTPLVRALMVHEPSSIGELAQAAGITQPAATQTIGLMIKDGLVAATPGQDARQKLIRFTPAGRAMLPQLQHIWHTTNEAARQLEAELPHPLGATVEAAIAALEAKPFNQRLRDIQAQPTHPKRK